MFKKVCAASVVGVGCRVLLKIFPQSIFSRFSAIQELICPSSQFELDNVHLPDASNHFLYPISKLSWCVPASSHLVDMSQDAATLPIEYGRNDSNLGKMHNLKCNALVSRFIA